ncbi:MAG: Hint domain-containing protein [Paracoccaceae bacterium]
MAYSNIHVLFPAQAAAPIDNDAPCLTHGSMIATPKGEVAVDQLAVGDRVFTRDNGIQELVWVGRVTLSATQLEAQPEHRPVLVRTGALGNGMPQRDMVLSPNHRVLVTSGEAEMLFDEREVLVAAKHLVGRPGIERVTPAQVTYVHIMCKHHEVVLSDGAWTESFQPDDASLKSVGAPQQAEIMALFPELADDMGGLDYPAARRALGANEARLLVIDGALS